MFIRPTGVKVLPPSEEAARKIGLGLKPAPSGFPACGTTTPAQLTYTLPELGSVCRSPVVGSTKLGKLLSTCTVGSIAKSSGGNHW